MTGSLKVVLRLPKALQKPGGSQEESTSTGSAEQRKSASKRKRGASAVSPVDCEFESGADAQPAKRKAVDRPTKGPVLLTTATAKPPKITIKQPIGSNDWNPNPLSQSTGVSSLSAKFSVYQTPKTIKLSRPVSVSPEAQALAKSISLEAREREKQSKDKPKLAGDNPHAFDISKFNRLKEKESKSQSKPRSKEPKDRAQGEAKPSKSKSKDAKPVKSSISDDRISRPLHDVTQDSGAPTPSSKLNNYSDSETDDDVIDTSKPSSTKAPKSSKSKSQRTPEKLPDKQELERVVDKIQKKDTMEIFREPVTEEMAPGYFEMIKTPMDFMRIREKVKEGAYVSWDKLESDLIIMFTNAMTYNTPDTVYYKQARTLLDVSRKLVELSKQGITNFRGRTAGIVRQHNAKIAEEEKREREQAKQQRRVERQKARTDKLNHKVAVSFGMSGVALNGQDVNPEEPVEEAPGRPNTSRAIVRENDGRKPLPQEENVRVTYKPKSGNTTPHTCWGGLANGSSAEGVSFSSGRPALKNLAANAPVDAYLHSIAKFIAGCESSVQKLVLSKLAECVPVESKKVKKSNSPNWLPPGGAPAPPFSAPQYAPPYVPTSKPPTPLQSNPIPPRPTLLPSPPSYSSHPTPTSSAPSTAHQPSSTPSSQLPTVADLHSLQQKLSQPQPGPIPQSSAPTQNPFTQVNPPNHAEYASRLNAALSAMQQAAHPLSRGVSHLLSTGTSSSPQQPQLPSGVNPLLQHLAVNTSNTQQQQQQQQIYSGMSGFPPSSTFSLPNSQVLNATGANLSGLSNNSSAMLGASGVYTQGGIPAARLQAFQGAQAISGTAALGSQSGNLGGHPGASQVQQLLSNQSVNGTPSLQHHQQMQ